MGKPLKGCLGSLWLFFILSVPQLTGTIPRLCYTIPENLKNLHTHTYILFYIKLVAIEACIAASKKITDTKCNQENTTQIP